MKRLVLPLAFLIAVAGCKRGDEAATATTTAAGQQQQTAAPEPETGTEVGSRMPEYSAMWLDGAKFELAKHRDKVVLLNVWATWCGPCRYEIPELQEIHNKNAPRGFEVIGVSVDESGVDAVKDFVKEHEMTYPVALDAEGKIANILQTSVLPTTVLIDRNGTIVWKRYGAILPNDEELAQAIEAAL